MWGGRQSISRSSASFQSPRFHRRKTGHVFLSPIYFEIADYGKAFLN
jgi:hypothetical protein